ncbi:MULTISPECIES: prepilin-type N-terminal cleavage/methylation domain-containing protein [Serratia]|uniref:Prepilin-type N-terminal cleavage/methylation domain-containing protein n=1 Tax=Serratia surfactantfaciens TaxID=2741499 RepID=A0ABS0M5B0_9GAMM|nr:prepilin-type N-terminal cleavage/methylation domain-containing protein [Serratia surfactantfaciens]MBH1922745.1 prepilin-type N-terminal cleavage/methylation domain-containing protein [Serratia surfactantfaciens]MTD08587.1 prepilin-type N-terminal cleavage/methylation domain-containing protein [Serratia sp. YC16]BEO39143.1 peptidase [Serratia marcescens]
MTANARVRRISRNGFSLPEVLVAALLFSVSLLGLLQYHQVLLQSFQRQWHYRQAWILAHQQLEAFAVTGRPDAEPPPEGWRRETVLEGADVGCRRLTASIQTPQRQWATLSRWYCTRF